MKELKIGDIVKRINTPNYEGRYIANINDIGVIIEILSYNYSKVRFFNGFIISNCNDNLEIIKEENING